MSQYPQPYYQQPYGQMPPNFPQYAPAPVADLLAPARRAGILQGILGGLMLLCGGLVIAIPHLMDVTQLITASGQQMPDLPPGWTMNQALALAFGMMGGCGVVLALAMLVLCVFVRSGSRGAVIASIILTGLILLMLAIRLIAGLVQVASNPAAIVDLLIGVVMMGLFGLNMYWLLAAARNGGRVAAAMQQYQAQYYGYAQQQQAYAQPGYGAAAAPRAAGVRVRLRAATAAAVVRPPAGPGAATAAAAPALFAARRVAGGRRRWSTNAPRSRLSSSTRGSNHRFIPT